MGDAINKCHHRYQETWQEDVLAIWKVWIPAQTINFAFMPIWARVPFTTCVSFLWTCYVSMARGKAEVDDEDEQEPDEVAKENGEL